MNIKNYIRFNILFCLFVILWGAWVRLSGSGDGCGEHWPLCDGEVIPLNPSLEKTIEFTHRFTSGLFGLLIGALAFIGFKLKENIYFYRSALAVLFFTIIEALIGAVLVKYGLVDKNDSIARAIFMGLHLVNTFLLVFTMVLTDFFYTKNLKIKARKSYKWDGVIFLILIIGAFGAIAALGDTLYPSESLAEGLKQDFSLSSSILINLRVFHPVFAVICLLIIVYDLFNRKILNRLDKSLLAALVLVMAIGVINWLMLAPTWCVLLHLLSANIFWIVFTRFYIENTFIFEEVK